MKLKRLLISLPLLALPLLAAAQGWPANYKGVMLQAFYWDSYSDSQWSLLESQAEELGKFFTLVWIPQSANCDGQSMGYDDYYWFDDYTSSFGSEKELRSMISTFAENGIGTIADVVINHRKNVSTWVDFPQETYNGVTYQLQSTDICADDDGGETAEWAEANGYSLSSYNDTGEGWSGMRDLDHYSSNVQTNVKAYLDFLLNDLGYAGFRYDMVKGYSGSFTGEYNSTANPTYSVGEYWDGNAATVEKWLNSTKVNDEIQSAAFDFTIRYTVRDVVNSSSDNWSYFSTGGIASDTDYQRYAVTFIENHDTEYRSSSEQQDPIEADTLAGNAYILAMPGTPCIFMKHWQDCKRDIKNMIYVRNYAGVTNQSEISQRSATSTRYVFTTTGTDHTMMTALGPKGSSYPYNTSTWHVAAQGNNYLYLLERSCETAWTDLPDGSYDEAQTATLYAISESDDAQIVYTLDGTTPTANSTAVDDGTVIDVPIGTEKLIAGLLIDGKVSGIIEREYTIAEFEPYDITVYVNVDEVGWSTVYFYTWGGDGTHASASWPGDKITNTTTIGGKTWYYKDFTINASDDVVNMVIANTSSIQTVDVNNLNETSFLEVSSSMSSSKYLVNNVTDDYSTGIQGVKTDEDRNTSDKVYSIDGRIIRSFANKVTTAEALNGLPAGIYIVNNRKVVIR